MVASMKAMRSVIAIVGPTASGKSALAMRIAKKYGGEIIAADSRTVYRDMDIGTAKPSKQDRLDIPHHLLDVVNPDEPFSVAEFKRLAVDAIDDIQSRGKLPILVGGTGSGCVADFHNLYGRVPNRVAIGRRIDHGLDNHRRVRLGRHTRIAAAGCRVAPAVRVHRVRVLHV